MPCVWCSREYSLLHWDRIPDHLKYNPHIQKDYRVNISAKQAFYSIFHWHNETINIWTHLMGSLLFLSLIPFSLSTWLVGQDPFGVFFVVIYLAGACFMLISSTLFHTFCCVSVSYYNSFAKMDYLGICVQIIGSYGFLCYYFFKCNTWALTAYLSIVGILGTLVIVLTLKTNIHGIGNEKQRLGLFIGFGFSTALCAPQSVVLHGWIMLSVFWRLVVMGGLYIFGASIYALQVPERWFPGKLNSYPSSHSIWHCFVLAAALMHYYNCFWLVHEMSFDKCPVS